MRLNTRNKWKLWFVNAVLLIVVVVLIGESTGVKQGGSFIDEVKAELPSVAEWDCHYVEPTENTTDDFDLDGYPDGCDPDDDDDSVVDELDNCPLLPNPDQRDVNDDGVGDDCE